MNQNIFKEIQDILESNNHVEIYCENENENCQILLENIGNYFILNVHFNENNSEQLFYNDLQELRKGAIDFIINFNTKKVIIKKYGKVLFLSEEYQKMINNAIKGIRKRETIFHFGKKKNIIKYLSSF